MAGPALEPVLFEAADYQDWSTPDDDLFMVYAQTWDHANSGTELNESWLLDHGGVQLQNTQYTYGAHFGYADTETECGDGSGPCLTTSLDWTSGGFDGQLKGVTHPDGGQDHYSYAWCGTVQASVDPVGRAHVTNFDAQCRATSQTWEGSVQSWTYDGFNRLKTHVLTAPVLTLASGGSGISTETLEFYYSASTTPHRYDMAVVRDGTEHTRFQYDPRGNVVELSKCAYDAGGVWADPADGCIESGGISTRIVVGTSFGVLGLPIETTEPMQLDYNASGAPLGVPVSTVQGDFDFDGVPHRVETPSPVTPGDRVETRLERGPTWTQMTDALGRTAEELSSTLSTESYVSGTLLGAVDMDELGRPTLLEDGAGRQVELTYGQFGQLARRKNLGAGSCLPDLHGSTYSCAQQEDWQYDTMGRVGTHTSADGTTQMWTYDLAGRPLQLDVARAGSSATLATWQYQDHGFPALGGCSGGAAQFARVTVTDELGLETTSVQDGFGRSHRTCDDTLGTSEVFYAATGMLPAGTQSVDGVVTSFVYDEYARQIGVDAWVGGTWEAMWDTYYDGAGRIVDVVDPDDVTTSYVYNDAGQLEDTWVWGPHPDRRVGPVTSYDVASLDYDAGGRVVAATRGGVDWSYAWDDLDRLVQRSVVGGTSAVFQENRVYVGSTRELASVTTSPVHGVGSATTSYTRNDFGWLTDVTHALGTVHYDYDNGGRLRRTTDEEGAESESLYDWRGRVLETRPANGSISAYSYNVGVPYGGAPTVQTDVTDVAGNVHSMWSDGAGRVVGQRFRDLTEQSYGYVGTQLRSEIAYDTGGGAIAFRDHVYHPELGTQTGVIGWR
jgi:YD repeat-containing protein